MKDRSVVLMPQLQRIMAELGENLKLARLRRTLTTFQICERAGISRTTLWQIEKGIPNVTIGAFAQVLFVLNLEKDLTKLGADDALGRRLQDANLVIRKRGPKKNKLKPDG